MCFFFVRTEVAEQVSLWTQQYLHHSASLKTQIQKMRPTEKRLDKNFSTEDSVPNSTLLAAIQTKTPRQSLPRSSSLQHSWWIIQNQVLAVFLPLTSLMSEQLKQSRPPEKKRNRCEASKDVRADTLVENLEQGDQRWGSATFISFGTRTELFLHPGHFPSPLEIRSHFLK